MYFRTKTTKTGRAVQLVESFRNAEGSPRQRIVVSLGDADIPSSDRRELARMVEEALYHPGRRYLIRPDRPAELEKWADYIVRRVEREGTWSPAKSAKGSKGVAQASAAKDAGAERDDGDTGVLDGVIASRVGHTHTTSLGPALAGLGVWEQSGMPELLGSLGFSERQRKAAAALAVNRLDEPVSEHAMPAWLESSSLPDLLGADLRGKADDIFYRTGDRLLENRERIEAHLRERAAKRFGLERTILLYDLTNTHFEGVCARNGKARRGVNKQKRNDCPQVVVGMVFDESGFELAHRTFEGNTADSSSLIEMLESLRACAPTGDLPSARPPLVVMDAGVATAENRRLLRDNGFAYLVNDTRPSRRRWAAEFADAEFAPVPGRGAGEVVEVCGMDATENRERPDGGVETVEERLVLCRSAGRREKESAIRSRAEERLLEQLQKLRGRVEAGRLVDPDKIQRAIGRIAQKNPRAARYYDIRAAELAGGRSLEWNRRDQPWRTDSDLMGCYVLRTNLQDADLTAERLWTVYITLTRAEHGFQMLKSDLGLRPNHHQIEDRVDAHIFITVLAHHLLQTTLKTLSDTGDTRSWPTLRRILQTHCYTTVLLPTADGRVHRIRRAGKPDAEQQTIYEKLRIDRRDLPESKLVSFDQETSIL